MKRRTIASIAMAPRKQPLTAPPPPPPLLGVGVGVGVGVGAGAEVTVNVAAVLVAVPATFVAMQRYWSLFMAVVVLLTVSEAFVPPLTLFQVEVPLAARCHCKVGVGLPLAVTLKVALLPAVTEIAVGCDVILGTVFTGPAGAAAGRPGWSLTRQG